MRFLLSPTRWITRSNLPHRPVVVRKSKDKRKAQIRVTLNLPETLVKGFSKPKGTRPSGEGKKEKENPQKKIDIE